MHERMCLCIRKQSETAALYVGHTCGIDPEHLGGKAGDQDEDRDDDEGHDENAHDKGRKYRRGPQETGKAFIKRMKKEHQYNGPANRFEKGQQKPESAKEYEKSHGKGCKHGDPSLSAVVF